MRAITIIAILLIGAVNVQAEGIKFFKGTWAEALEEANNTDKLIFVDAYTTWCGPCKAMSQNVFPERAVGEYYNANFINVKLDMERGEGLDFAKKYQVRSYPSFYYIDGNGKVVHQAKGARPAPAFIKLGEFAMRQFDKSMEYAELYEQGERDPDFLRKYAYALVKANKPHLKVANEYFRTQEDLNTENNLKALFAFMTEVDSRIFSDMMAHKAQLLEFYTPNEIKNKVEQAAFNTVDKAVEFKVTTLMDEAKAAIATHYPEMSKSFDLKAEMRYNLAVQNGPAYLKATKKYVKKHVKNNAAELHDIVIQTISIFEDKATLSEAKKWSEKAVKNGGKAQYYFTHAMLLKQIGEKTEALKYAKQGREVAIEEKIPTRGFDRLIRELGA